MGTKGNYTILIPAYEPCSTLCDLVDALQGYEIVVVNDGSSAACDGYFAAVREKGCTVLAHEVNRGKGRAIKTGIEYVLSTGGANVVTVDADGQHLPQDVARVIEAMEETPSAIIIGARAFTGRVPMRSRMGNAITRNVFHAATGSRIHDTQTGLRALPQGTLEKILQLPGDRYEFEIEMLLRAGDMSLRVLEVPIETVYLNGNKASHFNTFKDSWRIYKRIFKYAASSLLCAGVDVLVFSLLTMAGVQLLPSVVAARVVSVALNYLINTFFVFSKKRVDRSLPKYLALAAVVLLLNYLLTLGFTNIMNPYIAKVLANALLFVFSYAVQTLVVYKNKSEDARQ